MDQQPGEIRFVVRDPEPTCGAPSSKRKTAMHCELPPHHHAPGGSNFGPLHYGRNRIGVWRTFKGVEEDESHAAT